MKVFRYSSRRGVPCFLAGGTLILFLYEITANLSWNKDTRVFHAISLDKIMSIKRELNDSKASPPAFYDGVHQWKFVMNNPDICSDAETVDMMIIVHTAPSHLDRRQRMRQTFANRTKFLPFQVRIAFLLGLTDDETVGQHLRSEHKNFSDTILGDFKDDYHNLTLKGVMGYRWISEFCGNAQFVLKIDDDVMINMYKLLYTFRSHMYNKKKSIFCMTKPKNSAGIFRKGKWKVNPSIFYEKKTFPYDYCSGFAVLFTSDMMAPMYQAAKEVPSFWIDDLYLFGMLPSAVGGVTYYNYRKFTSLKSKEAFNCTQTRGPACPIFASLVDSDQFMKHWKLIENIYSTEHWRVDARFVE